VVGVGRVVGGESLMGTWVRLEGTRGGVEQGRSVQSGN
jgi:hypothetical protein